MGARVTAVRVGSTDDERTARDLLGLGGWVPGVLVGIFAVTYAIVAKATAPPGAFWNELAALVLVTLGAIAVVYVRGDPMPLGPAILVAMAGPLANAVLFAKFTTDITYLQAWALSASGALSFFLCVRGRTVISWISLLGSLGVCTAWGHLIGLGAGFAVEFSISNLGPQFMATFFAAVIRPVAKNVFALRRASTAAAAAKAANDALLDERDRQLEHLGAKARPLLDRLVDPTPLSVDERRACALVEAQLRDALRAPVLDRTEIGNAAWAARSRGVEVVLLDDRGLDDASSFVLDRLSEAVVPILAGATAGAVTVRVLPPGRAVAVTVLRTEGDVIDRVEYDHRGEVIVAR